VAEIFLRFHFVHISREKRGFLESGASQTPLRTDPGLTQDRAKVDREPGQCHSSPPPPQRNAIRGSRSLPGMRATSRGREIILTRRKYDMNRIGEVLRPWTEPEVRAVVGASGSTATDNEISEPWGRHKWFAEAIAQVAAILAMRRISVSWQPSSGLRDYAPAIRRRADETIFAAKLPPRISLAQWFRRNEPLLQRDPEKPERIAVVAAALLPLFVAEPACWQATERLEFDMSRGSFSGYLEDWLGRVPAKCRLFVHRIAREFGLEIGE